MKFETHLGCHVERIRVERGDCQKHEIVIDEHITLSGPATLQTYVPRMRIGSTVPKRHAGP